MLSPAMAAFRLWPVIVGLSIEEKQQKPELACNEFFALVAY
jgi:hypothetical protein